MNYANIPLLKQWKVAKRRGDFTRLLLKNLHFAVHKTAMEQQPEIDAQIVRLAGACLLLLERIVTTALVQPAGRLKDKKVAYTAVWKAYGHGSVMAGQPTLMGNERLLIETLFGETFRSAQVLSVFDEDGAPLEIEGEQVPMWQMGATSAQLVHAVVSTMLCEDLGQRGY